MVGYNNQHRDLMTLRRPEYHMKVCSMGNMLELIIAGLTRDEENLERTLGRSLF